MTTQKTTLACPYCHAPARLVDSSVIYGRSYGMAWVCGNWPECNAYVGCHRGTNKPKGTLANAETRKWRGRAHAAFDPLWRDGSLTRNEAYGWMCGAMGLSSEEAHIGRFDVTQCRELIAKVQAEFGGAGARADVLPCQGNDTRRFAIAVERKRRAKREPMTVDPNKRTDPENYSSDVWFWGQVEAKR